MSFEYLKALLTFLILFAPVFSTQWTDYRIYQGTKRVDVCNVLPPLI